VGAVDVTRGLVSAWFRTLLVQVAWNYDLMIGVGTAHASEPLLRDLPPERYQAAMRRSARFFNAHPYMVGVAIGAVARVEHDGLPDDAINRIRHALVGPLGSVGDKLVWAGVLPAAVGIGLIATALTVSPVVGTTAFLVVYNVAHLWIRTWGLRSGWKNGKQVARALTAVGIQRGLRIMGPAAALLVGLSLPMIGQWLTTDMSGRAHLSIGVVAVLAIALSGWLAPRYGGLRFGLTAAAFALVAGWVW
jgi:mannose/fructose/N-acetylgalactosamine-specific phosphotransferase system component IID